jgi:uroporphyrinogen decarboxylase
MDRYDHFIGPEVGLCPRFEEKVLEDRGDSEVVQDGNGVMKLCPKGSASIPQELGHTLVDRESWEKHFKWRLDPDHPGRQLDSERLKRALDPEHALPRVMVGGSLYGWIRDWMGLEGVSYLVYDDPDLFEEMVSTVADLIVEMHRRLLEGGASGKVDACGMWEDMCYNAGPLLSPSLFKKYLVPHYERITSQLRQHGCQVVWVDCDGKIDELLPMWFEAGVNTMFPIEVGTWGADPIAFRRQYGKDLLLMGGVDKRLLARSLEAITAEVDRLAPLVAEGGYIPFCDHRVPPDVPLANYVHYLEEARRVWGHEVNLKPMFSEP